uniref:Uncharacterized protein n=1 Tax=Moniliophthora roreri TaxID=221103 RepID=A0A0W0FMW7_MONRR
MPLRLIPEPKAIVSIATLAFLQYTSEYSIIFFLQNIAAWAYYTHKAARTHSYRIGYYIKPFPLTGSGAQREPHLPLLPALPGQVRNRVQGDLLSAFLIFQHMSFRDVVADIYLFTQERYNKNVLVRTGESLFGVDARTVGELTARLGEAYDSLQMGSIERSFIGTLHRL